MTDATLRRIDAAASPTRRAIAQARLWDMLQSLESHDWDETRQRLEDMAALRIACDVLAAIDPPGAA